MNDRSCTQIAQPQISASSELRQANLTQSPNVRAIATLQSPSGDLDIKKLHSWYPQCRQDAITSAASPSKDKIQAFMHDSLYQSQCRIEMALIVCYASVQ